MSTQPGQQTDFGANEWLVYEIHQQYLKDPDSVSEAWGVLAFQVPGNFGAPSHTLLAELRQQPEWRAPILRGSGSPAGNGAAPAKPPKAAPADPPRDGDESRETPRRARRPS